MPGNPSPNSAAEMGSGAAAGPAISAGPEIPWIRTAGAGPPSTTGQRREFTQGIIPLEIVKAASVLNAPLRLPTLTPFSKIDPPLSAALKPVISAEFGSSPVKSNVVRKVVVPFPGEPSAECEIQRDVAELAM